MASQRGVAIAGAFERTMANLLQLKVRGRAQEEQRGFQETLAGQRQEARKEEIGQRQEFQKTEIDLRMGFQERMAREAHERRMEEGKAKAQAAGMNFGELLKSPTLQPAIQQNPDLARAAARGDKSAFSALLKKSAEGRQRVGTAKGIAAEATAPLHAVPIPPNVEDLPSFEDFQHTPRRSKEDFMRENLRVRERTFREGILPWPGDPEILTAGPKAELEQMYKEYAQREKKQAYHVAEVTRRRAVAQREKVIRGREAAVVQEEALGRHAFKRLTEGESAKEIRKELKRPSPSEGTTQMVKELEKLGPAILEIQLGNPEYIRSLMDRFGLDEADTRKLIEVVIERDQA